MNSTRIGKETDKNISGTLRDRDTLRRALPYPTFEFPEKPQRELTNFTTEPKTRRYLTHGAFISGHRAVEFMETLFGKGLRECSWVTLRYEFIQKFQTIDPRTIDKYLGHPEETVRWPGSNVVRQNRNSGAVAHFMYSNERKVNVKKGLLEELGYMTKEGNRYILHHENFGYFTEQVTLETAIPLPEVNEESKQSNDNLCVRGLSGENNNQPILQGKGNGETVLEVSPIEVVVERKEEEDIDSTHTNQSSESEAYSVCMGKTSTTDEVPIHRSSESDTTYNCSTVASRADTDLHTASDTLGILEHITGIKLNPSEKRNDQMFERVLVASISCEILRKKLPLVDTSSIVKPGPARNDDKLERALGHRP